MSIDCTMYEYALAKKRENREAINYYRRAIQYDDFIEEVDAFAIYLQKSGISRGDNVALCLPNIPNALIAFYAANKIGAIANIVHPLLPAGGLKAILQEMPCKAVLIHDVFLYKYKEVLPPDILIIKCSMGDYMPWYLRYPFKFFTAFVVSGTLGKSWTSIMRKAKNKIINKDNGMDCGDRESSGGDAAVYLHSGGTTGEPKTVMLSNKAMNAIAYNINSLNGHDLPTGTSMLMVLPMFHVFGLGVCMHSTMSAGARALMLPYFKAKATVRVMRRERVTFVTGVPQMYAKMLKEKAFYGDYLKSMKYCYCGGDKLSESIIEKFNTAMRQYGSDCVLSEGYGLTEAGICTVNTADNYGVGSVGAPIGNVKIKIIDGELNEMPSFERGEICVGGDSIMEGYYNSPELNDKVFAYLNGVRYVRTGDMGYLDSDGRLYFSERIKRMVKISGVNVYPSEIEKAAERIEFVSKAIAIGLLNKENKPFVRLYVIIKKDAGEAQPLKRIREILEGQLMRYSVPREIAAVDSVPYTPLGKVDYSALAKMPITKIISSKA